MDNPDDTELVPLHEDPEPAGFDVVLRGYDRRQVDDYLDRVEVALAEADGRHLDDTESLAALRGQVGELSTRLAEAEARAAGRPERASLVGERLLRILTLAEEEGAAILAAAREGADAETAALRE